MSTNSTIRTNAAAQLAAATLAPATDQQLIEMIAALDTAGERLPLMWVYDECERRHPQIITTLEQWIANDDDDRSYAQMMIEVMSEVAR